MFLFPASRVVEELKKLEENLTAADQLCVEIAALCHDLGKGQVKKTRQLSYHVFSFRTRPLLASLGVLHISGQPWVQLGAWEKQSGDAGLNASKWVDEPLKTRGYVIVTLLDNSIRLEDYGLNPRDLDFIKELIDGPLDKDKAGYPLRGRGDSAELYWRLMLMVYTAGPEKYYLYEIVSNKLTGVDVDKVNKLKAVLTSL